MSDELARLRKIEDAARTYFTVRGPAVVAAGRALQEALALPPGVVPTMPSNDADLARLAEAGARLLPVVEAAEAVVAKLDVEVFRHDQSDCRCPARFDQGCHESYCAANPCGSECVRCALDVLAAAVRDEVASDE